MRIERNSTVLDSTFSALSDPTRRAILAQLSVRDASPSELAKPFRYSLAGVLKHLHVLQKAGLVEMKKRGRTQHCKLMAAPLKEATEWMAAYQKFWEQRLDALAQYVEKSAEEEKSWMKNAPKKSRSRSNAPSTRHEKKSTAHGPTRKS